MASSDPSCEVAHGDAVPDHSDRTLVAVFASPVAEHLLRYAADAGFRCLLLEPDKERASGLDGASLEVVTEPPGGLDGTADVVVTDHHRPELGPVLRDVLARPVRWVGVMGNPRHPAPHVPALRDLGVPAGEIGSV
jgi:xanthine dehydrogenase accessory factor